MKSIKIEDTKVGDFLYLIEKEDIKTRYIIKIIGITTKWKKDIEWWNLEEKDVLFNPTGSHGKCNMDKKSWGYYNIFKPNTEEILQFNKYQLLKNL